MMGEQTRIKPLEQAYYDECGTERTDKDRPNYKHWLEQRVTQLEAELEAFSEQLNDINDALLVSEKENDGLRDDIELSDARLLRLAEYINALAEDCDKQSVYLHIHGITDPWAESRKLFDQLPIAVRALLEKLRAEGEESK